MQQSVDRTHSAFGDGYSVKSRSSGSFATVSRYHDEPEADYDDGATELYRLIENKDWDAALSRLDIAPFEARTWVSRREPGSNKTRWRLLPLHAVCIFRAPLALIEALIEVNNDGPKMKDDQGMLPVHLACRNGASKGVVLTLLSAFPESIDVNDRKGRTPSSLVESSSSANREAVLQAIKRFQRELHSSVRSTSVRSERSVLEENEVDYEHRTVLFRLVLKKDWKAASARAIDYPEEAATWIVTKGFNGNLRFLPIHKACVLSPPEGFITSLLTAHPEAARATDQDGWLPLHCACFYGATEKTINTLLSGHPKGAQAKDDEGRLPLHYACLKGATQGVVDILLASFTKGAMIKDEEGRLAIHHACSKSAPEGIIDALLKAAPKGAQSKDDQGRLPLHHACRKNATERVIRTLLRVYPRACQIKDDQDKLPIHYACQNGVSPSLISLLLASYPESVNVANGFGFTPIAEIKALNNAKMDPIVRIMEKFKKEQDKVKAKVGVETDADGQVAALQEKITHLEKTLSKVSVLGKEMRNDLRKNKALEDILERFAEDLIELGIRTKTPLRTREPSPQARGFFGRSKTSRSKGIKSK